MSSSQSLSSSSDALASCDWLMDLSCPMDVVLGTATLTVGECAVLSVNATIRLKQPAGSDLHVRIAGQPFATGELAVTGDHVAVRLVRILPPAPEGLA